MARTIKGPLTLGDEALDQDYNAQMKDLMGQLISTPEEREKDELLAWSGGLSDPSGQASISASIGNANRAQSAYRLEDKKLRAQYIPLIMDALAKQQQAAAMQGGGGQLRGMPLERVMQLTQATGKDYLPTWKIANGLDTAPSGSYRLGFDQGKTSIEGILPDTDKPTPIIKNGEVIGAGNLPGVAAAKGQQAGATTFGQEVAKNLTSTTPVVEGGTKGIRPTREVNPPPTQFPELFTNTPLSPTTPSQGAPVPPQGPPQGGGPVPRPAPAPAMPTPQPRPAGGRPGALPDQSAQLRGNWKGTPEEIMDQINQFPPQIRDQMRQSYVNQSTGNNPPLDPNFVPNYDLAAMAAGKPPPVGTEPKSNFVQTELSPGQVQQNTNIEKGNDSFQKRYDELMKKSAGFDKEELNIRQLEKGLSRMGQTGPYTTAARKQVADLMAAAGFDADEKYLTNYQTVQQAIQTRVNTAIMDDRGVTTEGDAQRHKEATVRMDGMPKYNQYLLDTYKAALDMDKKKAEFYRKAYPYAQKVGKDGVADLSRIDRDWQAHKPELFDMPSMKRWR